MRVAVFGAGAIGSFYGGRLARVGTDVVLIGRGAHLEAVRRQGLTVDEGDGTFTVRVPATGDPAEAGRADLVLVCVKSAQTAAAAEAMRPLLHEDTLVLSLQNGVENEEVLARHLGARRVAGGVALVYVRVERPGVVRRYAGAPVEIGELDGAETERIQAVRRLFEAAGVPCTISRDLKATLWNKLIWNCALNGLTALTRSTLDRLMSSAGMRQVLRGVLEEAAAVARAEGVNLPPEAVERWLAAAERMGPSRSSTLDDLEAGRPLEVDALNGEVVRRAERHGVPVPYNRLIYEALRLLDPARRAAG